METWQEQIEEKCQDYNDLVEQTRRQLRVDIEVNRIWQSGMRAWAAGRVTLEDLEQLAAKRGRNRASRRKGLMPRERASLVLDYVRYFCSGATEAAGIQADQTGDSRLAAKVSASPYR
jgi:hypothetical protein